MLKLVLGLVLFMFVFCQPYALAYERIFRLTIDNDVAVPPIFDPPKVMRGNQRDISLFLQGVEEFHIQEFRARSFLVYTKEESDAKRAQDAETVNELRDKVLLLEKNLRDLTEINDALTRRLEEIEKRSVRE